MLAYFGCIVLLEKIVVFDELEKIFAFDELGDDVDVGLGLQTFFELQQQRVWNDPHDATLVAELQGVYAMRFLAYGYSLNVAISFSAYSLFSE